MGRCIRLASSTQTSLGAGRELARAQALDGELSFNAALSAAYIEFLGGALTILGLGMRFISIPMIINMIVAILTVKLEHDSGLDDFVELDEPLYALMFGWLLFSGAGWLSIDGLLKQVFSAAIHRDQPVFNSGLAVAQIH